MPFKEPKFETKLRGEQLGEHGEKLSIYYIDRNYSRLNEQKLKELNEKNKERFEKLNFNLENLALYGGDIGEHKYAYTDSFAEIITIDKAVLSDSKIQNKDFVICHEIAHCLIDQKLSQDFFGLHPKLREKKQVLINEWINKKEKLPPQMEDRFMERLKNRYGIWGEITLDKAGQILEKFLENFQEFKPKSTNPKIIEKLAKFMMEEEMMFNKKEPFRTEEEYERQAIIALLQLGNLLSRKASESEARKYNIGFLDSHFIEDGACHYLAAKLLSIPRDNLPYSPADGMLVIRDWERKLHGETESLITAIKKRELLKLYKET